MTRHFLLCCLCLSLLALSGSAQTPAPSQELPFAPLWISDNQTGGVTEAELQSTLDQIPGQPEDIVVLIHGFETTREDSAKEYAVIADEVRRQFAKEGHQVAIVGLQWDSYAGGFLLTLPWGYLEKADLSLKVGRMGGRQLLMALREKFPQARLTILAHSMGCEVAGAALRPDWGEEADPTTIFKPGEPIAMHGVVLLGSDLDYDIAYKGGVSPHQQPPKLLWLTLSRVTVSRFKRDRVLQLRALIRGKASGGTFPRMTQEQYDHLISHREVVFDNVDIPPAHHFLRYADEARLSRIVPALLHRADPKLPRPEVFVDIDKVMDGPGGVAALSPWFNQPDLSAQIYALWRLEHERCGSSKHLTDETLSEAARLIRIRPRHIRHLQSNSPCVNLRERTWPSPLVLEQFGAPGWAPVGGNSWIRYFRGEVTALSRESVEVTTDLFGMLLSFDLDETQTRFTPGREALRVGSKVEVAVDGPKAQEITVLPYAHWLQRQPSASSGPKSASPVSNEP